jgi:hypothetical protein
MGSVERILGNLQKALEYYEKALEIYLKSYGEVHFKVALAEMGIGNVLSQQGDY